MDKRMEKISVADLIKTPLCVSAEDAQKVFNEVSSFLKKGMSVCISFEQVTMLISLFLNVAIGQLYGEFSESYIRQKIKVEGLSNNDMELLKRVVDNAKRYYANSESYDHAWKQMEEYEQ